MKKRLSVGFIGDDVHLNGYIQGFCQHLQIEMMGFCQTDNTPDGTEAKVSSADKAYQQYADISQLLADDQIDVAMVCSPDHLHAEHALAALEAGKHVLCEKPLTDNLEDCHALVQKVKQTGLTFMASQFMRFQPIYQRIKQIYDQGQIGRAFFVEGSYIHDMRSYYTPMTWRSDPKNPQNILIGGGCHPLDLLRWTIDSEIVEVHAYANGDTLPDFPLDDCYIFTFQFENGCLGKVLASSGCRGHGMGEGLLSIYGTEGTIWRDRIYRQGEPEPIEVTSEGDAIEAVVDHFLSCVLNGTKPQIDVIEGAKTVAALVAGVESARTGQPVKVTKME